MCKESFQKVKNMVANEVCRTPTTTSLAIVLFVNKIFLSHHLFEKDGEGHVEFFKGEKLNQMLLKFSPLGESTLWVSEFSPKKMMYN
jgi:hypothetical protein